MTEGCGSRFGRERPGGRHAPRKSRQVAARMASSRGARGGERAVRQLHGLAWRTVWPCQSSWTAPGGGQQLPAAVVHGDGRGGSDNGMVLRGKRDGRASRGARPPRGRGSISRVLHAREGEAGPRLASRIAWLPVTIDGCALCSSQMALSGEADELHAGKAHKTDRAHYLRQKTTSPTRKYRMKQHNRAR